MGREINEITQLINLLAKLPGLGPVSSRRIVLHLLKKRSPLSEIATVMRKTAENVHSCSICGNFCSHDLCEICTSQSRTDQEICVVQDVADLWAMERSSVFKGRYHILGGVLSMLDNTGPNELRIPQLVERVLQKNTEEVILALSATVDGQTTAHYIAEQFVGQEIRVTSLGQGVPMGGELNVLDTGTINAAMMSRREYV